MSTKNEQFESEMKKSFDVEQEETKAEDNKKLDEVISGRQELFIQGMGDIIFDFPSSDLINEGDEAVAKFKSYHLRKGELLTKTHLKAIYGRPVSINVDGVDVVVGQGDWTEKEEQRLEDLPDEMKTVEDEFNYFRQEFQDLQDELVAITDTAKNKAKRKNIEKKCESIMNDCRNLYEKRLKLKQENYELNLKCLDLFSISLEEQAIHEKIKIFAPSCIKIKENGSEPHLLNSDEQIKTNTFLYNRVLSLFNLYIRGYDVSFFGDVPDGLKQ